MPITPSFEGDRFFIKQEGKTWATPLFLVVILIETTDLIFAVDSIPAILAISDDSFIVYTSNVFAILGLRSLYFALAGIEKYFVYLKYGLSAILVFVGVKMCIADLFKIPIEVSLIVIGFTLMIAMVSSRLFPEAKTKKIHITNLFVYFPSHQPYVKLFKRNENFIPSYSDYNCILFQWMFRVRRFVKIKIRQRVSDHTGYS